MINLVTRKSAKQLLSYFDGDFTPIGWANMWDAVISSMRFILPPQRTLLKASARVCSGWSTLDKAAFALLVRGIQEHCGEGGIISYEFAFSPPKSVSVAALAGPEIDEAIIQAHLGAVDETLAFLAPFLLERRQGRFHPSEAHLVRFTHPWNRQTEPQLHSHILIFRSGDPAARALYGYPFFLHQRTLRAVYHYSLASRLRRAGYAVRTGKLGAMAWELDGIPSRSLRHFAERSQGIQQQTRDNREGMFSLAVETRLSVLASRKQLPKTNAIQSLITARMKWRQKVRPEDCVPARENRPARTELLPVELDAVFRQGSIISEWQFSAIHLAHWIGSSESLNTALDRAGRLLNLRVRLGDVVRKDRGVCYPRGFKAETGILAILERGWSRLAPLAWKLPASVPKWLARKLDLVAQTADRVRIVGISGETLPPTARLLDREKRNVTDAVVIREMWDPHAALSTFQRKENGYVVLLVRELLHKGDFLQRLERLTPRRLLTGESKELKWEGADIRILNQRLSDYLSPNRGSLVRRALRAIRKRLTGEKKPSANAVPIIYSPATRSDLNLKWNWSRLEENAAKDGGGRTIVFGEKVDWETVSRRKSWAGVGLFVAADSRREDVARILGTEKADELGTLRHGSCWRFTGTVIGDGAVEAKGELRRRTFSLAALQALMESEWARDRIHFIVHRAGLVVPGTPLTPVVRFRDGKSLFTPGEILYVKRVRNDGAIVFTDGSVWAEAPCLMRPAYQVTSFPEPKRQREPVPVILFEIPKGEDVFRRLNPMPNCRALLIFSSTPEKVEAALREEISRREHQKHERNVRSILYRDEEENDDRDEYLPSRIVWRHLIAPKPGIGDDLVPGPIDGGPVRKPDALLPEPPDASGGLGGVDTVVGPDAVVPPGPTKKPGKREEAEPPKKKVPPINHLSLFWLRMFDRQARLIGRVRKSKLAITRKAPTVPEPRR